jgi:DNA-binding NarL/FixJ family response regulator
MPPIRVILADDHVLVRAGMSALINKIEGVEVIAEASDGREVLQLVEKLKPDLVLMDIAMPGMSGLEALNRLVKSAPDVRIIILSMHTNEEYIMQALRIGAGGYLLKDSATSELELAIKAVKKQNTYLSPAVSKLVVDYVQRMGAEPDLLEQLTPRQREILQLLAEGKTTRSVANTLQISMKTVESHRNQIMERLDIHDLASLVRYAVRVGLVSVDE